MNEKTLKTYDIASYDIELEYNKELAPIEKAIQKLNSGHEAKSLKAHKDFLSKELKSKTALNQLQEKSLLKKQRIERAVENKLAKLEPRLRRFDTDRDEYLEEIKAKAALEQALIQEAIEELRKEEAERVEEIRLKYKTNIESYVEKLDIYNNNYEQNKAEHYNQINTYQEQLNDYISDVQAFYDQVVLELEASLNTYLEEKQTADKAIEESFGNVSRVLNNAATTLRKNANINLTTINEYVDELKHGYEEHYSDAISRIHDHITNLQERFTTREALIEKDLEINVEKLETQLAELPEDADKKIRKSLEQKLELFQLRAATTIRYEQRLLDQQLLLFEQEQTEFARQKQFEDANLEKLRVFLVNDETSRKDVVEEYKDINITLREQLDSFEHMNSDYIYKHEQLKADFIKEYTRIFKELKLATIELAQNYLERIADNNHTIDEINKFMDTAEPLKEIEVNRLREDIEINEVHERYNIKYAKQQYEIDKIEASLAHDIRLAEINHMEQVSEYNKDVVDIRHKEVYDKAIEQAKLKHKKAEHVYKLRKNNINLEHRLLQSRFQTESDIIAQRKQIAEIDVRKTNALRAKEIDYAIRNITMEADYKVEVIQKRLEEDLMKLDEQVTKLRYEKDAFKANQTLAIETKTNDINQRKGLLEQQFKDKLILIDTALERELRQPTKNKVKTEAVIDERLSKLDLNNVIITDYITHALDSFRDDKLSLEQIQEVIVGSDTITDKAMKYLDRSFEVYTEAVTFMKDIDERNIMNQISSTSDQGKIKRLQKQLDKINLDRNKELDLVRTMANDHRTTMRLVINEELEVLRRVNPVDVTDMIQQTDLAYNKILRHLATLQDDIKTHIEDLYDPLTKADIELIDYANRNAETAKEKVRAEAAIALQPLDAELASYIDNLQSQQASELAQLDQQINDVRAQINHLKNEALSQTKQVQQERDEAINRHKQAKQDLETNEQQQITRQMELLDHEQAVLAEEFKDVETSLHTKEQESKKIFDYEDRIYNIAIESATARYNDALTKSANVHLNNVQQYKTMRQDAAKSLEQTEQQSNDDLLLQTKQFEQNIFTVRPRLEESIGDAQKEIDNRIAEKNEQLHDLRQSNERLITSAETRLFTAYQEGTDKLSDNLQNYIEKYRLIEEEFGHMNQGANQRIRNNSVRFSTALVELHKQKHAKTLEQLLAINADMFGKEV